MAKKNKKKGLSGFLNKLWLKQKSFFQYCRYFRNKKIRGITIDSPPIFITGCGHSGTSLLLAILGAHSRIYAVPFESSMAKKAGRFRQNLIRFNRCAIIAEKHRWVEKTPKHIYHIGDILNRCPEAKIIIIIRDGRDVARSIQARRGDLEAGIRRWVSDNLAGKAYFNNPNVHVVQYENLIADFEITVRNILSFLNETYEPGIEEYYKTPKKWYAKKIERPSTPFGKNHRQHRNWQINQPLFDGRGRWKQMSDEEQLLVNKIAGDLLSEFGYH